MDRLISALRPCVDFALCDQDLFEDLGRGEVSDPPHATGRAEQATHTASDLRRYANRSASGSRSHYDRLACITVLQGLESELGNSRIRGRVPAVDLPMTAQRLPVGVGRDLTAAQPIPSGFAIEAGEMIGEQLLPKGRSQQNRGKLRGADGRNGTGKKVGDS